MTANRFTLNGVTYTAKPFDFDLICDLEDMGVPIERIDKMPMSLIRAYVAICAGTEPHIASSWIQAHMANGGRLDDVTEPMAKEMNDSDFFRSLGKAEETEAPKKERKPRKVEESETIQQ